MSQQHPITPPKDLLEQLRYEPGTWLKQITIAYQAGANQELEACCKWLPKLPPWSADDLHRHRRPKPPSLKEQALADLDSMSIEPCLINGIDANALVRAKYDTIRRALEALDD